MRVFIAIEFSKEIKEYIYRVQQDIKISIEKGNFSNMENFHLTLKFIGELSQDKILSLKQAIEKTASSAVSFKLNTDTIGFFPRGNKKILWMALAEEDNLLEKLFLSLEGELEKIGIKKEERPFSPHITLVREAILKEDFTVLEQKTKLENREICVEKISLMESTRINGKLTYIPLYVCEIGK
jgi:RNA 2',3'-cyclic 3'-phosphodiesterase